MLSYIHYSIPDRCAQNIRPYTTYSVQNTAGNLGEKSLKKLLTLAFSRHIIEVVSE